jgi:hypothetical protein
VSGERLDPAQAVAFLHACVAVARAPVHAAPWTMACFEALEATFAERPLLPAPTLVLDLTVLLQGERPGPVTVEALPAVKDALRAYEDHVLARLTADRRWTRLADAVRAAPKELRGVAIALVVTQLLARLGLGGGTGVSQAVVRRLSAQPLGDVLEGGRQALATPVVAARVVEGLELLAKAARRTRELLSDAEVFLAENVASLRSLGARVALAQLATAAQQVEERLPARLKGQVFEDGDAPTSLEEDSAYPVGGFASIATSGSLENLVTSELIYMDDAGAARPDLFDVRFVEGELLYYSRDEAVAVRRRRAVTLVFDASLVEARVMDEKATFQRLLWLLGATAALVRKMAGWFDREALSFELIFVRGPEASLGEELGVVGLVLRQYRERGQLVVREAETAAQACQQARDTWGRRARVVLFGARFPTGLDDERRPDAWVGVDGPRPELAWQGGGAAVRADEGAGPADAWAQLVRALVEGVLAPSKKR